MPWLPANDDYLDGVEAMRRVMDIGAVSRGVLNRRSRGQHRTTVGIPRESNEMEET